jgi:hypothetical protein
MNALNDLLNDPKVRADYERLVRKHARIERIIGWMKRIPILGRFVHTFWFAMLDEGPLATLKPRWGTITYAFLNDGIKPTLWHTWDSMTTKDVTSLYVTGNPVDGVRRPPRSRAEADLWDRLWREQRERRNA